MRVATWNLRMGGTARLHWRRLIDDHAIDVLLVQESFAPDVHLPGTPARHTVWARAGGNRWGSAVHCRFAPLRPIRLGTHEGWLTGVRIAGLPEGLGLTGGVAVYSLHAPYGPGGYRGQGLRMIEAIAARRPSRHLIVGGDFNVAINETAPRARGETAVAHRLSQDLRLVNAWRAVSPGGPAPQTLRWSRDPVPPYSCDGLFVSSGLARRIEACEVLSGGEWDHLSDHNPMVATFRPMA